MGASGAKLPYRFCPLPADGRKRLAYSDLPPRAFRVLLAIFGMTIERLDAEGRRKTWTRAKDKTIAEQCGLCERSVRRALVDLERGSWLQRIQTGDRNEPRELRLGAAVIEMWSGERAEAEIRAGQQLLPFDRPELPGPSKAVRVLSAPRTPGVQVLRLAAGAEGLESMQELPVRTDLSALAGQICPSVLITTENDLRNPPPPPSPQGAGFRYSEEEEGVSFLLDAEQEGPGPAGKGPVQGDLDERISDCRPGSEKGAIGLELRNRSEVPAFWGCWAEGWDGKPPLPMDAERREDLHALKHDYEQEGAEVLAAAIRAGRDLQARGRLRLFDLRRYCSSSIRSTCIVLGRAAAAKAQAAKRAAAAEEARRSWDDRLKTFAQELRASGRQVSLNEAEALLRKEIL